MNKFILPKYSKEATASYIIRKNGDLVEAVNGSTGKVEFSGTDASTVIQSVINALTSGGKIYIKHGAYTLTSPIVYPTNVLPSSICIEGEDYWRTILDGHLLNDYAIQVLGTYEKYQQGIYQGYCSFKNLRIQGGVKINYATDIFFDSVVFFYSGTGRPHLYVEGPAYTIVVDKCLFHAGDNGGIYVKASSVADVANIRITNSLLDTCNNFIIKFEGYNASIRARAGSVIGCWIEPNSTYPGHGIVLYNTYNIEILGNYIAGKASTSYDLLYISGDSGVYNYHAHIIGNSFYVTGDMRSAIYLDQARYTIIQNNYVYGGSSPNIYMTSNPASLWIIDNSLATTNNIIESVPYLYIHNNRNYVTENSGTATITAGNTYVDVTHGLAITPDINRIKVIPKDNLGGRSFWVSNVGSTTFRINISSSDSVNHSFGWSYE